jgi:hypothetical protein
MEALFAGGHVADLILVVLVIEAVVLIAWHRRTGRGLPPRAVLALALPGAALVVALRLALTGAWWGWIALALLAAFAAHLADIAVRWRS